MTGTEEHTHSLKEGHSKVLPHIELNVRGIPTIASFQKRKLPGGRVGRKYKKAIDSHRLNLIVSRAFSISEDQLSKLSVDKYLHNGSQHASSSSSPASYWKLLAVHLESTMSPIVQKLVPAGQSPGF
jgi:hypothetical protein